MYLKRYLSRADNASRLQERNRLLQLSEAYKTIRGNLMFSVAGQRSKKAKIVMFTSSAQAEGKSTNCVNIASSFAQSDARVLVIDADLRKPKVEQYITGEHKRKGLSDFLGGFAELSDVIVWPDDCDFDCMFSGSVPPNPSELLMMASVGDLFEQLAERYDYIFIDTPPVGVVSETLYLTQFVTGVVLVVKNRSTYYKKLKKAIAALKFANANILGFVMNASKEGKMNHYYHKEQYYYYSGSEKSK